jgi:hypothetical protein
MFRACSRTLDFASCIDILVDAADVDFARLSEACAVLVALAMRIFGAEKERDIVEAESVGTNVECAWKEKKRRDTPRPGGQT